MTARHGRKLGQSTSEYLIIITLVAVASIATIATFSKELRQKLAWATSVLAGEGEDIRLAQVETVAHAAEVAAGSGGMSGGGPLGSGPARKTTSPGPSGPVLTDIMGTEHGPAVAAQWKPHYTIESIEDGAVANSGYGEPPYPHDAKVVTFKSDKEEVFYRVHGKDNKLGKWILRREDIAGLTPQQIKDKFNLPEVPTSVAEVRVPPGTRMRVGPIGPNSFGDSAGAIQYELRDRIPPGQFGESRPI